MKIIREHLYNVFFFDICGQKPYWFNLTTGQVLIYDSHGSYISHLSGLKLCIKLSPKVKSRRNVQSSLAWCWVFRRGFAHFDGKYPLFLTKSIFINRIEPWMLFPNRFLDCYSLAIRIFCQFSDQIVLHSPRARLNTEDNPRGLLRYHVGPYVLMGRTSYLYAAEYTYVLYRKGSPWKPLLGAGPAAIP